MTIEKERAEPPEPAAVVLGGVRYQSLPWGKARGLAFARLMIGVGRHRHRRPGVRVSVPRAAVLGTDAFDRFLDENELRDFALQTEDDAEIRRRFEEAPFPESLRRGEPWMRSP